MSEAFAAIGVTVLVCGGVIYALLVRFTVNHEMAQSDTDER
jgi:hypothetical protein